MCSNNEFIYNIKKIIDKTNNENINNLYNDMSTYQKRIFDSWNENIDTFIDYSLNDLLFDFDKDFIEKILEMELESHLNSLKKAGIYNKKNGSTKDISLTFRS